MPICTVLQIKPYSRILADTLSTKGVEYDAYVLVRNEIPVCGGAVSDGFDERFGANVADRRSIQPIGEHPESFAVFTQERFQKHYVGLGQIADSFDAAAPEAVAGGSSNIQKLSYGKRPNDFPENFPAG